MKKDEMFPGLRGCIELALYDALPGSPNFGKEVSRFRFVNSPTRGGVAWAHRHYLSGESISSQSLGYMALGTDTTAPSTADSALGSEIARKAIGTWATAGDTANPPYWVGQVDWGTGEANGTIGEVGLFNSSSGGTMLVHGTTGTFEKATSNTLGASYTVSHNVT